MDNILMENIKKLKKEKQALILAHYYVDDKVQEVSDYVGDSYYLSKIALERPENIIVFCGVTFMGESAKILSPHKKVLLPVEDALCPMAYMIDKKKIQEVRKEYDDLAIVCYINSTAEAKAYSDVCVTSSNAYNIINNLKEKNIFFIPDNNLGRYLSSILPHKNFIFNEGYCPIHQAISKKDVLHIKKVHNNAEILVHPECTLDVIELADFVGSTSGIIDYATKSQCEEFIICTEMGIEYELRLKNPHKSFYKVIPDQYCGDMKKITLESIYKSLKEFSFEVNINEVLREKAEKSLKMMHNLGS